MSAPCPDATKYHALRSTPLNPIATRMRELTGSAEGFWTATAFLSAAAVNDIIAAGLQARTHIHLLPFALSKSRDEPARSSIPVGEVHNRQLSLDS